MEDEEDIYDAVARFREENPDWDKVLTNSTFQTTHNNAMKPQIVIYAGKGKLSETVQNLLFSEGITWGGNVLNKSMFLERVIYITVKWDSERFESRDSSNGIVQDYSADTEMGKITEWLEWRKKEYGRVLLERENERLKQEITQLRDEIDAKSAESFPEGYDWHNPHGLTPAQVGVSEGWRLLLKSEIAERNETDEIQKWYLGRWHSGLWNGNNNTLTYRTKWPLPSPESTPTSHPDTKTVSESTDDDFPTPERQEKEAGLKWFLEYLKRCKEVKGWVSGKVREVEVNYGKCKAGAEMISHNGYVCLRDNYGDIHRIAITQINP